MIPRTVHFIYGFWDSKPMHELYKNTMQAWEKEGAEVKLWNKEECEVLIASQVPQWLSFYHSLSRNVQKCDFARCVIIYTQGGYYADLDCVPRGFSWVEAEAIYLVEHISAPTMCEKIARVHKIRRGVPELSVRVANYFFGAKKGHASVLAVINKIQERCKENPNVVGDADYYVLYTTGPSALTRAIHEYDAKLIQYLNTIVHFQTGSWRCAKDSLQK